MGFYFLSSANSPSVKIELQVALLSLLTVSLYAMEDIQVLSNFYIDSTMIVLIYITIHTVQGAHFFHVLAKTCYQDYGVFIQQNINLSQNKKILPFAT